MENNNKGGIPDEVKQKIDDMFPVIDSPEYKAELKENHAAVWGYSLASEELACLKEDNERLKGEVDTKLLSIHGFVKDAREIIVRLNDNTETPINKKFYTLFSNTLADIMDEITKLLTPFPTKNN